MTYPRELKIENIASLASSIGDLGLQIGPRKGPNKREADDREWWCFRRWLFTLGANGQLMLPVEISRPADGGPDFLFHFDRISEVTGLEITEATNHEDSIEMTKSEDTGGKAHLFGAFGGRSYDNTSEKDPKADYIQQILCSIDRKIKKADQYLQKCDTLEFLIYANNNACIDVNLHDVAGRLSNELLEKLSADEKSDAYGRVAIIDGQKLLVVCNGEYHIYQTLEFWPDNPA